MTKAVRLAVPKPLIFSSASFSLFSFAWLSVAMANVRPKIPDCGLFDLVEVNAEADCDIFGKRGFETAEELFEFPSSGIPAVPNVKAVALVLIPLVATDCGIIGKRGFETAEELVEFPSSDGPAAPNVKAVPLVWVPLVAPNVLLDETSAEELVEEPSLLKPPKVRLVEDGCLVESMLKRELALADSADETKDSDVLLLWKPDPKIGTVAWDVASTEDNI